MYLGWTQSQWDAAREWAKAEGIALPPPSEWLNDCLALRKEWLIRRTDQPRACTS
jgi:hypothetical protein